MDSLDGMPLGMSCVRGMSAAGLVPLRFSGGAVISIVGFMVSSVECVEESHEKISHSNLPKVGVTMRPCT